MGKVEELVHGWITSPAAEARIKEAKSGHWRKVDGKGKDQSGNSIRGKTWVDTDESVMAPSGWAALGLLGAGTVAALVGARRANIRRAAEDAARRARWAADDKKWWDDFNARSARDRERSRAAVNAWRDAKSRWDAEDARRKAGKNPWGGGSASGKGQWWDDYERHGGNGSASGNGQRWDDYGRRRGGGSSAGYSNPSKHEDVLRSWGVDASKVSKKAEVKKVYRDKAKDLHPDKHPGKEAEFTKRMQDLNAEWEKVEKSSWYEKLAKLRSHVALMRLRSQGR